MGLDRISQYFIHQNCLIVGSFGLTDGSHQKNSILHRVDDSILFENFRCSFWFIISSINNRYKVSHFLISKVTPAQYRILIKGFKACQQNQSILYLESKQCRLLDEVNLIIINFCKCILLIDLNTLLRFATQLC